MTNYIGPAPVPQAVQRRETFTATAGQTSFATAGYTVGYIDVYLNGVHLVDGTDYTATNGSDVVLTTGAAGGDTLETVAFTPFQAVDQAFTGDTSVENLDVTGDLTVDTDTLYVDSANNRVGIGTSSPSVGLEVSKANLLGKGGEIILRNGAGKGSGNFSQLSFKPNSDYTGEIVGAFIRGVSPNASSANPCDLVFGSGGGGAPTERMRIDSAGNVLVGTTSSGGRLTVNPSGVSEPNIKVNGGTSSSLKRHGIEIEWSGFYWGASNQVALNIVDTRSASATDRQVQFSKGGSVVGNISCSLSATSYNTSSDERLKENITDADDASAVIDGIQVRQFDWKADGEHQRYGMIAQELDTVAPEAVTKGETEDDMWAVDYSKLVPMLVKEIQDLRKRVEELETSQ